MVRPNGFVPTLLILGAYPCMIEIDALLPIITQRSVAMQNTIEEVRKSNSSRKFDDTLNTQNGPSTSLIYDLPLNSPVLVFYKGNTS